jgi:esterase/lipase superfamily enzyme
MTDMHGRHVSIQSDALGAGLGVVVHGHYGRPLLAFPSERGGCWDYEEAGMIDAIAPLVDVGRVKVYCVDTIDGHTWHDRSLPLEERARRHGAYEHWILHGVVPFLHADCGASQEIIVTGPSFGAYHAANVALKRPDLFPLALCHSGVYDVSVVGGGECGDAVYFNNPLGYVPHLHGDHLDWLRSRVNLLLVCGQGQWEDTTGALESTRRFAAALAEKGLRHELDLWGHDVAHDWPWWRAQLAHHLPRFC